MGDSGTTRSSGGPFRIGDRGAHEPRTIADRERGDVKVESASAT